MSELAKLVGEDTYHHIVDPAHFRKGDRFRMERVVDGKKFVRYGEAAMDGLAVHPSFGWLSLTDEEAMRSRRASYEDAGVNYINVRFDDRVYHDTFRLNESVYPRRHALVFYSTAEVRNRKTKDLAEAEERVRARKAQRDLEIRDQEIKRAQDAVTQAELALADARNALRNVRGERSDEF